MPEFMLLFREGSYDGVSPQEMQSIVEKYIAWARKLRELRLFKDGDELKPTGRVLRVQNGRVVDGPFSETKEIVGGYMRIEARDYDHAVELSRECPGLAYGTAVEIRQISDYQ